MALETSATINTPEEQQAAADMLRRTQTGLRRQGVRALEEVDATLAQASTAANIAYKSLWDRMHDVVEQLTLTIATIFFAPIVVALYLIRFIVGGFMHGGFTLRFRTFELKGIPALAFYDVKRHAFALGAVFLLLIQITLLTVIFRAATDKLYAAKISLCATLHEKCT